MWMLRWMTLAVVGGTLLLASARAIADVRVSVRIKPNLADTADPMPELWITNDSKDPIELDAFHGVPFTALEQQAAGGTYRRRQGGGCGNGFAATTIPPGHYEAFPLWSRLDHGPGSSGTFRLVVPYVSLHRGHRIQHEAVSPDFQIAYGDIPPGEPIQVGEVVLVTAERSSPAQAVAATPVVMASSLIPRIKACVADARTRLPWLRGQFRLQVYQFGPTAAVPALLLDTSLLGDQLAYDCLAAITPGLTMSGEFRLTFAITGLASIK